MFDREHLLKALKAEGVELGEDKLNRVLRRLDNPAGCESCGARTKLAGENPDGSLSLLCCGEVIVPAPKKGK